MNREPLVQPRKYTNQILQMVEDGLLDPITVLSVALNWHSDDDVKVMGDANEFLEDDEED